MVEKKIFKGIIFVIGFMMCAYPFVSCLVAQRYQNDTVATYEKTIAATNDEFLQEEYEKATEYNRQIDRIKGITVLGIEQEITDVLSYDELLNISDNGIMGSIEIPKIDVNLPIYHGTGDDILSSGIGHVEGTSLPIGGVNTRAVLTGHRGLPNAKLFTRLDEIEIGDMFFLTVLNEKLAYKVNDIDVILPENTERLEVQEGKDLVTLLTCTPYGINTHRLIVTGERVDYEIADYEEIESQMMSPRELIFSLIPFLFLGILVVRIIRSFYRRRKMRGGEYEIKK